VELEGKILRILGRELFFHKIVFGPRGRNPNSKKGWSKSEPEKRFSENGKTKIISVPEGLRRQNAKKNFNAGRKILSSREVTTTVGNSPKNDPKSMRSGLTKFAGPSRNGK
jgi:hypothetical protein